MQGEQPATRVLLIEDSEDDAELVLLELERAGLSVDARRVDREPDLRAALAERSWDVVISDFAMPSFDGLRAFQLVKALAADVPFIFVSGAIGEERAVEAMRAGARDYILKDNLKRLAAAVRRELEEAAVRRQRLSAEARALRDARRLAAAVEASGAGVYEYHIPATADSYYSERWAEILGFRLEELPPAQEVPTWFARRVHPEDRAEYALARSELLAGSQSRLVVEVRVARKDGSWIAVTLLGTVVERGPDGAASHVVGVMLDLTERRRLEDQLRQAQKMEAVGRLAGGVAHDFNNLLTVIYTFGGFVLGSLEPGSAIHADMQEVIKAAQRAASLTGQLLAFSRRQTIEPKIVNVDDSILEIEKLLRRVIGEDVGIVLQLQGQLGKVRIDPGAFEQVLLYLAINACDAMPSGGTLTVATSSRIVDAGHRTLSGEEIAPGTYVEVTVSDTGVGMTGEILEQVFEPFFTTKPPGKGTGLGLSTCHGIIRQARGYMTAESEPGRGTTVRVLLPRTAHDTEPAPLRSTPPTLQGTETILVVEDDDQVRKLSVRVLSRYGYRVLDAANGAEALALVEATAAAPIDLLVTDMVMPGVGGRRLATELRALRQGIRVLYVSGHAADSIEDGAFEDGTVEAEATWLQKPFTPEHLARSVRELLDRD